MLIASILLSVTVVMLDSVAEIREVHGVLFYWLEWFFTLLFTVEYMLRLAIVGRPLKYAVSFYGIVDLLSILPTYLSFFLPGGQYLVVIRTLRTLRIWRILKLVHFVKEFDILLKALRASTRKIVVFLAAVFSLMVILGSTMYVVETAESGFTSIPRSVYWAVVTLTTVGYGDISPKSGLGQIVASIAMILGYAIIAVPTGIVTVEIAAQNRVTTQFCPQCSREGHDDDALFCKFCGSEINPQLRR